LNTLLGNGARIASITPVSRARIEAATNPSPSSTCACRSTASRVLRAIASASLRAGPLGMSPDLSSSVVSTAMRWSSVALMSACWCSPRIKSRSRVATVRQRLMNTRDQVAICRPSSS
jgi:hypothetical protein